MKSLLVLATVHLPFISNHFDRLRTGLRTNPSLVLAKGYTDPHDVSKYHIIIYNNSHPLHLAKYKLTLKMALSIHSWCSILRCSEC